MVKDSDFHFPIMKIPSCVKCPLEYSFRSILKNDQVDKKKIKNWRKDLFSS